MHCFLFILLFSLSFRVYADVIFTSERCNRVTFGLRTVNGDPSRYKQCGPSGRVWIVPCAPQMTFDPEDRVCKERSDSKVLKPMRKYEVAKNIITTPAPTPASYPVSAEVVVPGAVAPASAPEEFVFSTIRPKSRRPKARTKTKMRKTTTAMIPTTTEMPLMSTESAAMVQNIEMTTPKIVIFASKKGGNRNGEQLKQQLISRERGNNVPAFTRPGRIRTTTPLPVTHATRFVPGAHMSSKTVTPKEAQGMPHTLAPYEKVERRVEKFEGEEMTTMTPEYTVRYNGKTMTESEFLNQLLHIVQHQKAVSERQQQDKFEKMEQERLRQEKEERVKEMERRRKLEETERERQAELERQAAIYAEQERMAMERERELERIRLEERKREMERIRQEEIAMEIARMRELERLQMERQQKNKRVRQELEAARKAKTLEEERQRKIQEQMEEMEKIRAEQEEERQRELRRLEEERSREIERVRQEEQERHAQIERLRQQEEERRKKKLEKERQRMMEEEEQKRRILEKELEDRRREMEEERKRKVMEKEMEERQKAILEEEKRRKVEEERRKQKELEEKRQIQEQMRKAIEERTRLEAMDREREMMRQILESERELEATTPVTTIKPIYRPRPDISEYRPPDVESHMIRFTTQAPEWATLPPNWQPEWNTVTVEEEAPRVTGAQPSQCSINGECELQYDSDSFCAHPNNPSMYLQCAPLYGRRGRWTERQCPDTLVFLVGAGRCEKSNERKPYDPDNRVVIPRLPSETSFVEWKGNRVIDNLPNVITPPRVYPPVPETHQPQIYNTIDEFPKDLLPKLPEVSPADTYAQQYQNHIHGSVISGGHSQQVRPIAPTPTVAPIPMIPSSYQFPQGSQIQHPSVSNSIKSEIDLSHIHPLFPRVQPDFLSRILPTLNLKLHDENSAPQSLGSVVKPVIKKIALNHTEQFLDRLLADQVRDEKLRQEIIDRLKSSNVKPTTGNNS